MASLSQPKLRQQAGSPASNAVDASETDAPWSDLADVGRTNISSFVQRDASGSPLPAAMQQLHPVGSNTSSRSSPFKLGPPHMQS